MTRGGLQDCVFRKIYLLRHYFINSTYSKGIMGGTEPFKNLNLILCTSPGRHFWHTDSCTAASVTNFGKKALERHLG